VRRKLIGLYARWRTENPRGKENNAMPCAVDYFRHANRSFNPRERKNVMYNIVWIIGAIVIIIAVLSFFGLR
jgi:hypothetical protein